MCDAYILTKPRVIRSDFDSRIATSVTWQNDRMFRPEGLAPVLMPDGAVTSLTWGFRRPFFPCLHLANLDYLRGQPWKRAFKHGRCIVPMTSFLEVEENNGCGRTFEMSALDSGLLWAAGLWDVEHRRPRRFALIMVETPVVAEVFQRPAIMNEAEAIAYLSGATDAIPLGKLALKSEELPGALRSAGPASGSPPDAT